MTTSNRLSSKSARNGQKLMHYIKSPKADGTKRHKPNVTIHHDSFLMIKSLRLD
jgi:hypothetical protein